MLLPNESLWCLSLGCINCLLFLCLRANSERAFQPPLLWTSKSFGSLWFPGTDSDFPPFLVVTYKCATKFGTDWHFHLWTGSTCTHPPLPWILVLDEIRGLVYSFYSEGTLVFYSGPILQCLQGFAMVFTVFYSIYRILQPILQHFTGHFTVP